MIIIVAVRHWRVVANSSRRLANRVPMFKTRLVVSCLVPSFHRLQMILHDSGGAFLSSPSSSLSIDDSSRIYNRRSSLQRKTYQNHLDKRYQRNGIPYERYKHTLLLLLSLSHARTMNLKALHGFPPQKEQRPAPEEGE